MQGSFGEECLGNGQQCLPFQPGQQGVTSSMLFSVDTTAFPAVRNIVFKFPFGSLQSSINFIKYVIISIFSDV